METLPCHLEDSNCQNIRSRHHIDCISDSKQDKARIYPYDLGIEPHHTCLSRWSSHNICPHHILRYTHLQIYTFYKEEDKDCTELGSRNKPHKYPHNIHLHRQCKFHRYRSLCKMQLTADKDLHNCSSLSGKSQLHWNPFVGLRNDGCRDCKDNFQHTPGIVQCQCRILCNFLGREYISWYPDLL